MSQLKITIRAFLLWELTSVISFNHYNFFFFLVIVYTSALHYSSKTKSKTNQASIIVKFVLDLQPTFINKQRVLVNVHFTQNTWLSNHHGVYVNWLHFLKLSMPVHELLLSRLGMNNRVSPALFLFSSIFFVLFANSLPLSQKLVAEYILFVDQSLQKTFRLKS